MTIIGLHWIDFTILMVYFAVIIYVGVIQGAKQTKTLGDFYVAGGKWGPLLFFIFVFASAVAGNEAVVVAGGAYKGGLSGVWYWWSFLFATPFYFLFSTHYRRARVYNLAEFLEMRYSKGVTVLYAIVAGLLCMLFIGGFLLAIAKILAGITTLSTTECVIVISVLVAAYVASGGMMSAFLTDILQGLMCLFILSFVLLPFLWIEVGGFAALRALPKEIWSFTDPEVMSIWTVLALNLSALVGGIAGPWIYNWIAVSKDEKTATQCGWGHLWKRVITLLFALYGILFVLYKPGLTDPESAWGPIMKEILPIGVVGLLVASFFAAAMSSADTWAIITTGMHVDFIYRKILRTGRTAAHYLKSARIWAVVTILLAALSTTHVPDIKSYVKLSMGLLGFLGIPIYFGVYWRRANRLGVWLSLILGIAAFTTIMYVMVGEGKTFANWDEAFPWGVFVSIPLSTAGMIIGCFVGRGEDLIQIKRFHVILNTAIGEEERLVRAGIRLPAMIDADLVQAGPEELDREVVEDLYEQDSHHKVFGPTSTIELRREPNFPWYFRGFVQITLACIALVVGTWLITRILFVW